MILDDTKNAALKNNYGGKSGFFKAAVDIYMHGLISKTKEENKAQLKCYAGSAGAVIYDNGALSSCENKPDVLNLRDYDWDFQAAWKTKLMQERRVEAGAGCFCTHESNCFYPSLPFNAKHLIKIKKLEKPDEKSVEGNDATTAARKHGSQGLTFTLDAQHPKDPYHLIRHRRRASLGAALAIAEGLQKFWKGESVAVRTIKAVEESHHITDKLVNLYNWVLQNKQHWMKYLYWAMNKIRPETREFFHKRCLGYVRSQFEKWCPHIVVSVHPLTQHAFARVLKELNLAEQIPLVTVVTDPCYGFWKGWACDDVSLYLVANEDARRQLIDYGISPEKIKVSGMPVDPKFHEVNEADAQIARTAYGLSPDKFTVFLNAGWIGGGNIPKIFKELVRGELDVQAIFLAGKNEELVARGREDRKACQVSR